MMVGVNPHIIATRIRDCIGEAEVEIAVCGDETICGNWKSEHRSDSPAQFVGNYFECPSWVKIGRSAGQIECPILEVKRK